MQQSIIKSLQAALSDHQSGELNKAAAAYRTILTAAPNQPDALNLLGVIHYQHFEYDKALPLFNKAIEVAPSHAEFYYNRGNLYRKTGQLEKSINDHKQALKLAPTYAEAHHALGLAYKIMGDKSQAVSCYEKAIEIKPDFYQVYWGIATLQKATSDHSHVEAIQSQIKQEPPVSQQIYLYFALAREYHDMEHFELASEALVKANQLKRNTIRYSIDKEIQGFKWYQNVFSENFFSERSFVSSASKTPIFIVGMPRSGSSLLEHILASHSQVYGAGEQRALPDIVSRLLDKNQSSKSLKNKIASEAEVGWSALGTQYLNHINQSNISESFITDKMPVNFKHVGFIKLMMPQAKVIHIKRNRLDNMLACYSQLFSEGNHFTYQLDELAAYYDGHASLMAYWKKVLPDFIYEVDYEDIINDFDNCITNCLQYCGLEWEDGCAGFHNTKRAVNTASATQVRQPLYSSSIGRWKQYASILKDFE